MLALVPIIGPFLLFASWAVYFTFETILFITNQPLWFGLKGNQLQLLCLGMIAVLF